MSMMTENITGDTGITTADGGTSTTSAQEGQRIFTQGELNKIVQERLAKERAKADATLAAREQELAQREFQLKAKEIMEAKNLPVEILGALNATDEKSLNDAIDLLGEHIDKITETRIAARDAANPNKLVIPAVGRVDMKLDPDDGIRRAMGLK